MPINLRKLNYSPHELQKVFSCDFSTGRLTWRERSPDMFTDSATQTKEHKCNNWNSRFSGKEAFTHVDIQGYVCGSLFGKPYKAHRIVWAMKHGKWPVEMIDHINKNKIDNAVENLREATHAENARNRKVNDKSSSKLKGVTYRKHVGNWQAQISKDGTKIYLGSFNNPNDAHQAYCNAAKKLHGDFAGL